MCTGLTVKTDDVDIVWFEAVLVYGLIDGLGHQLNIVVMKFGKACFILPADCRNITAGGLQRLFQKAEFGGHSLRNR